MIVPSELRTPRLLLRPWRADDAAALLPVLEANHARNSPWIPARVANPAPIPELSRRLAEFAVAFDADREWRYGMFAVDGGAVLGEISLFPRNAAGRSSYADADRSEIGYWLRADAGGKGLVTEGVKAVMDAVAGLPSLSVIEIRCDARNRPSAAIPQRLGFVLAAEVPDDPGVSKAEPAVLQVWRNVLRPARLLTGR